MSKGVCHYDSPFYFFAKFTAPIMKGVDWYEKSYINIGFNYSDGYVGGL